MKAESSTKARSKLVFHIAKKKSELWNGRTVIGMKVSSATGSVTDKARESMSMAARTSVLTKMTSHPDKEFTLGAMARLMRASGRTASSTVTESRKSSKTMAAGQFLTAIGTSVYRKVSECATTATEVNTRVNG